MAPRPEFAMKHFLGIEELTIEEINHLLSRACAFKQNKCFPNLSTHTLGTLFYENSTRTRISFELAAKKSSMDVVHLNVSTSSVEKGESIEDTIKTLAAMGIDSFVIRHAQNGLPRLLATRLSDCAHLINAGDGTHSHPTQAMLDLMTIFEKKPNLPALKVAILGDILHSRVANSLIHLFSKVGISDLRLIAPPLWQPQSPLVGWVTSSIKEGLQGVDVIICLRVQKERLQDHEFLNTARYHEQFALTEKTLNFAQQDAIILHPGPINRGVEIDSEIADHPQSCILEQVKNGVFMRMAVLDYLFS